jgi:hypothetical protein
MGEESLKAEIPSVPMNGNQRHRKTVLDRGSGIGGKLLD